MSDTTGDGIWPGAEVAITVLTGDGERVLSAVLNDTPAARELLGLLPLRLHFADFNAVEKLARLPRPLSMAGMPAGDDPEPGDVGFYAPTGDLVLYYRDVGYWPGIARLGRLSQRAVQVLSTQDVDFDAVIAAATEHRTVRFCAGETAGRPPRRQQGTRPTTSPAEDPTRFPDSTTTERSR